MRNVSNAFRNELYNDNRNYIVSCDITFSDGTKKTVTNAQIWSGGFKVEDSVSGSNNFEIGAAIVGKFTLVLNNIYDDYSDYDFYGAEISNVKCGLKLPDGTTESVSFGKYTVDEPKYNGSIITLSCLDNMSKFDRPYSESNLTYPATLGQIVRDACNICDVPLASDSATFDNDDYVVDARPDDNTTFREVLSWVGQISCHWLKCNNNGQLSLRWYDRETYDKLFGIYDAGNFNDDIEKDTVDAGTFANPADGDVIDFGTFSDSKKYHHIYSTTSTDMSTDDVTITGIRVTERAPEDAEDQEDIVYQYGEDGYVLGIEGNELIQSGKGSQVASYLGGKIVGLTFRPLSLTCLSDPTIESGDLAIFTDRKGRSYKTLITSTTFQAKNYQKVSCDAESPSKKNASRISKYTKVYQDLKNNLKRQKTAWEQAIEDLDNRLTNSSGLYSTIEQQEDGSNIYYLHDKPTLEESEVVWKMTAEAWGVSTNGGETWNGGMTVDGDVIARILTSIGVNADWINTGALVIQDADGNIMFRADVDTGIVDIIANTLSIRGKTVEEIAQDNLSDYVNEVFDPAIDNLQAQIDGQIETWFYDYVPTTSNAPASQWATDTEKEKHLGDLFYIVDNEEYGGQAYRWAKINNAYAWDYVEDTATTKALADAAKAQDTADNKRRVFISTPVPPYDAGDLWWTSTADGAAAIKVCKTGRQSGTYVSTDWIDNKYIDESTVNNAITEYDTSLGQTEIFNKLTNGGQTQGIYIQNGKLYINADYILSGTVAGQRINAKGIRVLDANNNVTFEIDNNGNVTIRANTFSLQGSTIQNIANSAASSAANSALTSANNYTDNKASSTLSSAQSYATNQANNAYNNSKNYTDNQLANFNPDVDLSQQEIFNILTNNGQTQGIYLSGGRIYINATYIDTGNLAGWTVNRSSRTLSCTVGSTTITLNASSGRISITSPNANTYLDKFGVDSEYITGGTIEATGRLFIGSSVDAYSSYVTFSNGKITFNNSAANFSSGVRASFYTPPKLYNLSHVNSGGHLVFASDGATLAYLASSSKRYKTHVREMTTEDVKKLYNLPVVYFKFVDGYIDETDERYEKSIPGFYAEDMQECFPDATDHIKLDGETVPENWNERMLIPAMMKLIQTQHEEIETLKSNQQKILQALSKAGIEVEI